MSSWLRRHILRGRDITAQGGISTDGGDINSIPKDPRPQSSQLQEGPSSPEYPEISFTRRVEDARLDQMTIAVSVWRAGSRNSIEEQEVTASRILTPGKEAEAHLSKSYSFELFQLKFQQKMNALKPHDPVEMKYGKCGYFTHGGDHKFVRNQDDFEVALGHLFLSREKGDVLKFIFQPESVDAKMERELEEAAELDDEAVDRLADEIEAAGFRDLDMSTPPRVPDSLGSRTSPATLTTDGTGSSPISIPGVLQQRSPVFTPDDDGGSLSLVSSGEELGKRSSLGAKLKQTFTTQRQRVRQEPYEERHERIKGLYNVVSKSTYKRGGADEIEETPIEDLTEANATVFEGEIDAIEEADGVEDEEKISDEDRVVAKLQSLQDLPELTQLEEPGQSADFRWNECCRMFNIDPAATGMDFVVSVAGLKTKIYQYQAFAVYWQMKTSRKFGGGFVGDEMGLGKTLSFLAYFVVERQLSCLWLEVEASRKALDGKHLRVDQQSENDKCPIKPKAGWIVCPCASTNPTSQLAPKPGVRLACVPEALIRTWWSQWKTHIDTSESSLGLTIVIDYLPAFDNRVTIADMNSRSNLARNKARLEAEKYRTKCRDDKGDDIPKSYQDGWLVLTTIKSYQKWIKTFEYPGLVYSTKHGDWRKGNRRGIVFGIAMIDESHEEYFKEKGRAAVLTDIPSGNQPFIWGYSGTPFSQTPRGLEGVLWAIEKHTAVVTRGKTGWETDPDFQPFANKKLDEICKAFDGQVKSKTPNNEIIDQALSAFKPFLLNFMIRRRAETLWFGHRLIKLKPHLHQDISFARTGRGRRFHESIAEYEASFQEEKDDLLTKIQEKWDQNPETRRSDVRPTKLAFNTLCRLQWRTRILTTFPFLVKLATVVNDPKSHLTLTDEECLSYIGTPEKELHNPYNVYINYIVEDSPKCLWLYFFIHQLCGQKDVNGNEQKLVIITNFPQVAFILKLFIRRYFPEKKDRVGMIIPRMGIKERTEVIEAFTDAVDDVTGKRKHKRDNQFLIGTTRLIGQGLQLTRACHVVLMEPDCEFVRELQGYARVHRIGQKNPYSFSYRLIDSAGEIEQKILKRQEDRKEIVGRRLDVDELLQIEAAGDSDQEKKDAHLKDEKIEGGFTNVGK